ncbi:MAG: hypothetical protein JWM47_3354 [Acidimicrobiales bacterium]|nr:hypothetical protein [Acidimicrobiales bacterium]
MSLRYGGLAAQVARARTSASDRRETERIWPTALGRDGASLSAWRPTQANTSGYQLLTPAEALLALHAQGDHVDKPAPLSITTVKLGSATFLTDRGSITLPAWQFWFRNITNPASVLAVSESERYRPPGPAPNAMSSFGARRGPNSHTITLSIIGAPAGTGPYTADAAESPTAAAIDVHEISHHTGPGFCTLEGHPRNVTVVLQSPLGNRVLVDSKTKAAAPVDR